MRELELWQRYDRREVHDIFSPETRFTPGGGTWGMQGIVKLPDRPSSYVFFVTFGTTQGDHEFDESITPDGVLTWQSQPKQLLQHPTIQELVNHDDRTGSVFLFLRSAKRTPYRYCGRLGYIAHDEAREQPVWFHWQLLDWPPPGGVEADLVGAADRPTFAHNGSESAGATTAKLTECDPPGRTHRQRRNGTTFKARRLAIHPDQDARNRRLGRAGELLVLRAEKDRLVAAGRDDLSAKVAHVAAIEGDGAGYDIKSFTIDGEVRHLEVKTTRSGPASAFYISPNEVAFSNENPGTFVLVRVFWFDMKSGSGSCYRVPGSASAAFSLTPSEYRASPQAEVTSDPEDGRGRNRPSAP